MKDLVEDDEARPTRVTLFDDKEAKTETASMEESGVDERDLRTKQVFRGWKVAWLAYQSLGVIYGDIGTSPLYVYSSTFSSAPSHDDILGAVSLVIWALTIMVTIKYVCIVLLADDEGEGGTFALYSLLSRYSKIINYDPRYTTMVRMERYSTDDLQAANQATRSIMEKSTCVKWLMKVIGAFGVALLLADGVLTPAQSILGAIQGATVVNPDLSSSVVVGVSCALLVFVFAIQPLGTSKIASAFAPIVIVWMCFNFTFGVYNLVMYDFSVFKAFSPYFAGAYLVRNKKAGWLSLGGILLSFTGVETLYADLGAFSHRPIQISWLFFVYPCLLIQYIGQGAYMMVDSSAYANPFYLTVPPGMLWPSLIIAVLACIVASQAAITGSYQLLSQVMKLSYFPHIKVYHTSKKFYGQVYIPLANWLMMVGTIIVTAVYHNTTRIGEAYGSCVILVSFMTTCMVTVVSLIVWRLPIWLVLPLFLIFAAWDGMFLSAALSKVPYGAWFTLMIAVALTCVFMLWRFGKEQQWKTEESDNIRLSEKLVMRGSQIHQDTDETSPITYIRGLGIFFDKSGSMLNAPTVFLHFLQKFSAMPEVTVFLHLRPLSIPSVPDEDRYTVMLCYTRDEHGVKQLIPNCYRIIIRHGYTDQVITPDLHMLVFDIVRSFLVDSEMTGTEAMEILALTRARDAQVIYIVGKEQLKISRERNLFSRAVLWVFLLFKASSRSKIQDLNVEMERIVEVGFVKLM